MNLNRLIVLVCTSLLVTNTFAGSDIVLIDYSEKAYTVYAGLPMDRVEALKSKFEGKPLEIIPLDQFAQNQSKIVESRVIRNDYQGDRTGDGIVALIKKYPGTPFGVTWNGGIAYTRNDYQDAKNAFELFNKTGKFTKPESDRDPVNPMNHLKPLLGW